MITKAELLKKIESIDDQEKLNEIAHLIEFYDNDEEVYHFNDELLQMINEAEEDIKNGRLHTHDEIIKMTDEWSRK